ncbi:precorrin-6y C5,15-methyltransferase (decarboxylating) subunit CbiE [Prochlorococcus marinus]|uniref:precorrin-6y C5,15-methyltransferase (decarboxylating) subunit CbiE n=1 Tax=Prochlorococcus marinus TaxID=1219 RepID=UPI0022B3AAC9|nr:precorrin-6y C5,15-methyltransferase (decarboxylating) subunit CbiE [Prochlorococcus marinus]
MTRSNTNTKNESNTIEVIGVPASGVVDLCTSLQNLILSGEKISAPKRLLSPLINWWKAQHSKKPFPDFFPSDKPMELISWLKKQDKKTILLATGDPLWFGIGRILIEHFPREKITFHPSPTSLQLAFSRLARPWQDATWTSLHGRESISLLKLLKTSPETIGILIDPNNGGAKEVREILFSLGLEYDYFFWIFEKVGDVNEKIYKLSPDEELPYIDPLHLVILIRNKEKKHKRKDIPLFGIEDDFFKQYDDRPGLMTKREVRIQVLADLELPKNGVIWDVGAGVGSIGLEALRISPNLQLLCIDKRIGSKSLIEENANLLSVKPEKIIEAEALDVLVKEEIPIYISKPKRVILGGGSYKKIELLKKILRNLCPGGIIVIPLATIDNLEKIMSILRGAKCKLKISQHQNYRGVPLKQGTRFQPMNPVFIIKAKLEKKLL